MARQLIGSRIAHLYRPEAEIGRGGMGVVYRASDTEGGGLVAVKALKPAVVAENPELLERFSREGEALRQLNHPNIVGMVAAVEEGGQHFLIMEYVPGGSLTDLLYRMLEKDPRRRVPSVRQVGLELEAVLREQDGPSEEVVPVRAAGTRRVSRFETLVEEKAVTWLYNLPADTTRFIGRRREIADVKRLLAETAGEEGKRALAWALSAQGVGARAKGDYQTEFTLSKRIIQLHRELGDPYLLGLALSGYAVPAMALGEYQTARAMLDEGVPLLREAGNPYRIAMALNFSGDLARCEGDYSRALSDYEESITLLREIDAVRDLASAQHNLGHTCLHLGEVDRAQTLFEASLAIHQAQQNHPGATECLLGFAALAIVSNRPAGGVRLLAAAAALGGRKITVEWAATRLEYEHYLARARNDLREEQFLAAQAAGERLTLEQAVTEAESAAHKAAAARRLRQRLDDLTPREREVASLIAQGRSNEQIADELVLSKRTVEKHIANIRSKLSFTERTQIVRWAIESGLVELSE